MTFDLIGSDLVVPRGGFRWARKEVPPAGREKPHGPEWVLEVDEGTGLPGRTYNPLREPALFLNFAGLDFNDRDVIRDFANRYGWLDLPRFDGPLPQSVLGDPDSPPSPDELVALSRAGEARFPTRVESHRQWAREIFELQLAVRVWDCVQKRDRSGLVGYLTYGTEPIFANVAARVPAGERAEFDRLSAQERKRLEGWSFDTHRGRPVSDEPFPGRVRDRVSLFRLPQLAVMADRLHAGDIFTPATVLLWKWANAKTEGVVKTRLMYLRETDRLGLLVVPVTLLGAMWLQFMQAVDGKREYRACRACGTWYAVSSDEGGVTRRREFCSDACKARDYRRRRDRARELKAGRKTLPQIVKQLSAEGLETDAATVKKWITKGRGD
jgi:hypothetical protein